MADGSTAASVATPAPAQPAVNPFRGRAQVIAPPDAPEEPVAEELVDPEEAEQPEDVQEPTAGDLDATPAADAPADWTTTLRTAPQRINEVPARERGNYLQRIIDAERANTAQAVAQARERVAAEVREQITLQTAVGAVDRMRESDPDQWAEWSRNQGNLEAYQNARARLGQFEQAQRQAADPVEAIKNEGISIIAEELGENDAALEALRQRAGANGFPATPRGLINLRLAIEEVKRELRAPARAAAADKAGAFADLRSTPKAAVGSRGGGNEPLTFEAVSAMSQKDVDALMSTEAGEKRVLAAIAAGPKK